VEGTSERPRLTVFRSAKHIYAQVIDDTRASTLAHASTLSKELKGARPRTTSAKQAKKVGASSRRLCKEKGVNKVVFDRNGYLYHGRVSALAQAPRDAGLEF
jgi:large subunit ribosomal protein L18